METIYEKLAVALGAPEEQVALAGEAVRSVLAAIAHARHTLDEKRQWDALQVAFTRVQPWGNISPEHSARWADQALEERRKRYPEPKVPEPEKVAEPAAERPS